MRKMSILTSTKSPLQKHDLLTSKRTASKLHIQANQRSIIHFGTCQQPSSLHYHHNQLADTIQISPSLSSKIQLPGEHSFAAYLRGTHVWIGPLIGIFTAGFTDNEQIPLGKRSKLFAKYLLTTRKFGGFAFVFGVEHINWREESIDGFCFDTSNGWQKRSLPIPNVIYDQTPNRKIESLPQTQDIKAKLINQYELPWFNTYFFNKWDIHQQIKSHPTLHKLLPESLLSPTYKQLQSLLSKHHNVFLKPVDGSLGKGIQLLRYNKGIPQFECHFHDSKQNRKKYFSSLKKLIIKQFPNGCHNFIAQQAIELIKSDQLPVDFRVHTNKDDCGVWRVSALAAKMAGEGSITTHFKNGGKLINISQLLSDLQLSTYSLTQLKKTAIELSELIDSSNQCQLGEIGFDLAIDCDLKIWLLEANSRPGREIFSHPHLKRAAQKTLEMPIQYAVYLFERMMQRESFHT